MNDFLHKLKKTKNKDDRQEKFCSFIVQAQLNGLAHPKSKIEKKYTQIDSSMNVPKIYDIDEKDSRVNKVDKDKCPGPGTYDALEAKKYPEEHNRQYTFRKHINKNFTDEFAAIRKDFPAVG